MKKRIAIQGIEGSLHQVATENYFGKDIEISACLTFNELVRQVSQGEVDMGMMAIENSTAGSILQNYELLQAAKLFITGELYLQIRQHLIALKNTKLEDIKEVHSHPMAIYQCKKFLEKHPSWELSESKDTALSVKDLKNENILHRAVIASNRAAEIFGLEILREDIHTEKNNYTRFLAISKEPLKSKDVKEPKASIYFQVEDKPSSLAKALILLGKQDINLSKVQSFPIPGSKWQYYFHADLIFKDMKQFETAIQSIKEFTKELRILGIYNQGKTI